MTLKVLAAVAAVYALSAFNSQAYEAQEDIEAMTYHRVKPCSGWKYDSNVRAYVCSYTGGSFEAADRQEINRLERRIEQLEARLADLQTSR